MTSIATAATGTTTRRSVTVADTRPSETTGAPLTVTDTPERGYFRTMVLTVSRTSRTVFSEAPSTSRTTTRLAFGRGNSGLKSGFTEPSERKRKALTKRGLSSPGMPVSLIAGYFWSSAAVSRWRVSTSAARAAASASAELFPAVSAAARAASPAAFASVRSCWRAGPRAAFAAV